MEQTGTVVETWIYVVLSNGLHRVAQEEMFQHNLTPMACKLAHFVLVEEVIHTKREISVL